MILASLRKHLPPLPIASYILGFFAVTGVIYAVIGGWMLQQSDEITQLAEAGREASARKEMHNAMERVDREIQTITARLAGWDEVYQQLGDPTFYEYWHSNRALRTDYTPGFVTALELYDSNGDILQNSNDGALPQERMAHTTITVEEGRPYLYSFTLVSRMGDSASLMGYLGIKVDFHRALLDLNRFNYLDMESINYTGRGGPYADIDSLLANTRYQALPIAETGQLVALMNTTVARFAVISLLLLIVAYVLTSFLLHAPLRKLSGYIDALRRGQSKQGEAPISRPFCVKEFEVLRHSIISYQRELEQMHSSLDQKNRELWKLAHNDALTGVQNRRAYEQDWKRLQQLIRGQRITLSVVLIDCDHFKAINDSYGHEVGDMVLQAVAAVLQQSLREGDQLYRLGGDEFALHLLNTEEKEAEQIALHCLQQLEQHDFKQIGIREPVRFSIGLATASGLDMQTLNLLHKLADIAMYQAKRPGSSKVVQYNPALSVAAESLTSNRYISAIYRAIEYGKGIELHYQPVLSMDGEYHGFHEVLLRLRDREGLIPPSNIFPIVDAEGLAVELDYAIIRHLVSQLQSAVPEGYGRLSINIDGDTLMHHDFMAQVATLKPYLERVPQGIVLEITETALISELKEAGSRLQRLRQLGFTIALDDFGSGYSSLRYLASMPVDIVKFDIDLIRDLEKNSAQSEVTAGMAGMIRRAGYQMVAEGIEGEALLERVRALGFTHVQGYLFGQPATLPITLESAQQGIRRIG